MLCVKNKMYESTHINGGLWPHGQLMAMLLCLYYHLLRLLAGTKFNRKKKEKNLIAFVTQCYLNFYDLG